MDVREKLVELLFECAPKNIKSGWRGEKIEVAISQGNIADYLIAHGVTVQGWISVKDRLPEKDGKYLVARADGGKHSISVRKFRKEVPCWYTGYCGHWERRTNGITHWQPLPEPPSNK